MRHASAAAFAAWIAWTIWVVLHYFEIPGGELFVLTDGPLRRFPFWHDAAREAFRALGGAALVALAAWGAGSLAALPARGLMNGRLERVVVVLALGFAGLGSLFFLLAGLRLYRPTVLAVTLVLFAIGGLFSLRLPHPAMAWRHVPSPREALYACCAAGAVACAFIGALAPETEYDALWYHLWLPARWLETGRAVDIVEEYVSLYPLSWDLVSGGAMTIGGPVAAKLLHFICLPLMGASAFLLSRQLFPESRPMLAAALAMVTPITIWEATTAYIDLALAWYLSMSVYAFTRYHASRDRRWLILSALLMSGALAIKHLALVGLAIVTCAIAARELHASRSVSRALRTTLLFVVLSMVLPAPWYARAFMASGNPVFPDMYGVFGASPPERWNTRTERALQVFKDRFGTPRARQNPLRVPWDATVHAAAFGGTIGPLFLILVPGALLGRTVSRSAVALAAGCAAYAAVWASPVSSYQLRFLIPIVPLLAALGAEGAARVERAARLTAPPGPALVTGVVVILLLLNLPPTSGWHEPDRVGYTGWMTHIVRALPAGVVFGAESRQDYLRRTVPSYAAWQHIDAALPADVRILTFSGGDHLYSTRPRLWSDAAMARPATWDAPAGQELSALEAMRRLGITHVLFDRRQLEDGSMRALAIGSDVMRACCLAAEYDEGRFVLYRLRDSASGGNGPSPAGAGSAPLSVPRSSSAARSVSPSGLARHACGTWNCPSMGTPGSTWRVVLPSHQAITLREPASRTTAVRQ